MGLLLGFGNQRHRLLIGGPRQLGFGHHGQLLAEGVGADVDEDQYVGARVGRWILPLASTCLLTLICWSAVGLTKTKGAI